MKNYLCKLSKPYLGPGLGFTKVGDHELVNVGCEIAGTITARYYKGAYSHGDNIVLVQIGETKDDRQF